MQRSISDQKSIKVFLYIILFIVYNSLSTIYLFLPPLFAVLFVLFSKALDDDDSLQIILVSFCLLIFEVNFNYLFFSSIIYFYILYRFIMPKLAQNFSCNACIKISTIILSYLGYYIFLEIISNIFLLPEPEINFYTLYYIVIEFFIVGLL